MFQWPVFLCLSVAKPFRKLSRQRKYSRKWPCVSGNATRKWLHSEANWKEKEKSLFKCVLGEEEPVVVKNAEIAGLNLDHTCFHAGVRGFGDNQKIWKVLANYLEFTDLYLPPRPGSFLLLNFFHCCLSISVYVRVCICMWWLCVWMHVCRNACLPACVLFFFL